MCRIKALSLKFGKERYHVGKTARFKKPRTQDWESQRKDGRYLYKYVDADGKPQSVYSWKLVATDKVPAGKRDCIALRDKEREIQKSLADGISTTGRKMTVCELYDKYTTLKGNGIVKKTAHPTCPVMPPVLVLTATVSA